MASYDLYLDKLVVNSIEMKGHMIDILSGMKDLSSKLDTLIALKEVELGRQQQPQEPQ